MTKMGFKRKNTDILEKARKRRAKAVKRYIQSLKDKRRKDKPLQGQKTIRKIGKRGKINREANKKLYALFIEKGIMSCEVKLKGCLINEWQSFAHRHKRRWYYGKEELLTDWKQVILACVPCHSVLEKNSKLTEEIFQKLRGNEI